MRVSLLLPIIVPTLLCAAAAGCSRSGSATTDSGAAAMPTASFAPVHVAYQTRELATAEQGGATWVKLPGAVRPALVASQDGAVVMVTERAQTESRDQLRLRLLDLSQRRESELGVVADVEPRFLPDGGVLAASREKPAAGGLVTRVVGRLESVKRLVRIDPATGARTPIAPDRFDVDTALVMGQDVYFTAGLKAWKVPVRGGEPVQVAEEVSELYAPFGGQFVVSSTSGRSLHAAILALDGGQTDLGEQASITGAPDGVIVRRKNGTLQVLGRGTTKPTATPLPCAAARLLPSATDGFAACDDPGKKESTLHAWTSGSWKTVGVFARLPVVRAANLGAGRVAVLLEQKTAGELSIDGTPEADLYVLESARKDTVRPTVRDLPLRMAEKRGALVSIAQEAGLPEPSFRTSLAGAAIRMEADAEGPATLDELRKLAASAQQRLAAAVSEPRLGVDLHYGKSDRYVRRSWDAALARMVTSAGYAGTNTIDVSEAEDFDIEVLEPKVEIREGLGNKSHICSGRVKNLSERALPLLSECGPLGVSGWGWGPQGPPPGHRTAVEPSPLAGGQAGKYYARGSGADAGAQQLFLLVREGKDTYLEAFDVARHERALACFELQGAMPPLRGDVMGQFGLTGLGLIGVSRAVNTRNRCGELLVVGAPEGFAAMPADKQAQEATRLGKLMAQVQARHPKATLPTIKFVDGAGKAWALKAGRWAAF